MKIRAILATGLLLTMIQSCSQTSITDQSIKLYVLDCGEITVKDISLFSPNVNVGVSKRLANTCYLIKHPKGNLLWETGLNDNLSTSKNGISIADGMFHLKVNSSLVSQLQAINIACSDIDYLALSHFHFDHTGNMNLFLKSKILIQQEELTAAFSDKATKMHFDPNTYNRISKEQFIALNGRYDVFNDESVVIFPAPGHTPGHQVLQINLKHTGSLILSGDLYHFKENRVNQRVPLVNFDENSSLKSMVSIEKQLTETQAKLWIQHDMETFNSLRHSPVFYD
ncbi:MAG: N-acyl homoserine lactone hydrolase [Alteromonadaceae bacterium]|jgi:N-acyl homoserine lactone hydrolase